MLLLFCIIFQYEDYLSASHIFKLLNILNILYLPMSQDSREETIKQSYFDAFIIPKLGNYILDITEL